MLDSPFWSSVVAGHLVATILTVGLVVYIGRTRWTHPMGRTFTLLVGAFTVWIVGSLVRLFVSDPTVYVAITVGKWIGVTTAPVLFLLFALLYAGRSRWVTQRTVLALLVLPGCTLLLVATTQLHGLVYGEFLVTTVAGIDLLQPTRGPWFWIFASYGWGLITVATGMVVATAVSRAAEYYAQSTIVVLGIGVAWVVNLAYVLRDWPHPAIDPTPLAFAVTAVFFAVGIFTTTLVNVVPIARSQVTDAIEDPVMVFDDDGQLAYGNDAAGTLFGDGSDFESAAREFSAMDKYADGGETTIETNEGRRVFQVQTARVTDDLGSETGQIVYLNEVTSLREREERIAVLNRILRHNIRNNLNITAGHLEVLTDRVSETDQEHVKIAQEQTQRVIDLAEKARTIEQTLEDPSQTAAVSPVRIVESVAGNARRQFPGASIAVNPELDPAIRMRVVSEDLSRTALAELVENAVVHNDHEQPDVIVRITWDSDRVEVSVSDNGPTIPVTERRAVTGGSETSLEHASGVGLWLVRWVVSLSSGELSFRERDAGGNVVSLSFQIESNTG